MTENAAAVVEIVDDAGSAGPPDAGESVRAESGSNGQDADTHGSNAQSSLSKHELLVAEGDAEVLDALQELTRLAAMAETGQRSRLMLDIAGYRARRRTELGELGRTTAEQVVSSGEAVRLAPMNPFERKVVHDAVGKVAGASSSSEGEEPRRRVVISPAS